MEYKKRDRQPNCDLLQPKSTVSSTSRTSGCGEQGGALRRKAHGNVGQLAGNRRGCLASAIAGGVFSPAAFASKQERRRAEEIRSFNSSHADKQSVGEGRGKRTSASEGGIQPFPDENLVAV